MKKLDNIVVESLNREHGEEIIKTFNDLEVNTMSREGFCCKLDGDANRYYGLIDGVFSNYTMSSVRDYKCKIITLKQLKSMKEDKSEYPKLMYVGSTLEEVESDRENKNTRVVFMEKNGRFLAWINAKTHEEAKQETEVNSWKYAQDIEETPEPKKEVIDIAMNKDILKYAIIKINGKEVEYKK